MSSWLFDCNELPIDETGYERLVWWLILFLSLKKVIHRCSKQPVIVSYIAFVADNCRLAADNLPQEANNLRLAADNSRLEADNLPQKAINLRLADD